MLHKCVSLSLVVLGFGCLMFSGCADQKPEPGKVTTVSPPIAPKGGEAAPAEGGESGESKPAAPAEVGSTLGGGTEETPGNGQ